MTLRAFFELYYLTVSHGDVARLAQFYLPGSAAYEGVKAHYESLLAQYELQGTLEQVDLVAKQDDLLIVRAKVVFVASGDDSVSTSRSDNLHMLAQSNDGQWKIHSSVMLSVGKVLSEESSKESASDGLV